MLRSSAEGIVYEPVVTSTFANALPPTKLITSSLTAKRLISSFARVIAGTALPPNSVAKPVAPSTFVISGM